MNSTTKLKKLYIIYKFLFVIDVNKNIVRRFSIFYMVTDDKVDLKLLIHYLFSF